MIVTRAVHDLRRLRARVVAPDYYQVQRDRRSGQAAKDYYRVFDETQSIFVHIPKSAGISVAQSLYGSRAGRHERLAGYQIAFPASAFYKYYKFTFVRNPWDRVYSAYRYLSSGAMGEPHDLSWIESNLSDVKDFEDFVVNLLPREEIRRKVHFRTQESFLRSAVTGKVGVDFIGRFESIDQDFSIVSRKIGKDVSLPHLNRSKMDGRYRDAFSSKMRGIVGDIYAVDTHTFGYVF